MPISIACSCGKKYRVKEALAGKKIRCADCSELIKVPAQEAEEDAEFDEFAGLPPARAGNDDDEDEDEPSLPPRVKRRSKPAKSTVKADKPARQDHANKGWFESTFGSVLGGILMMVVAIVWFVVGLFGDRIFFYPPVLLIIGFVTLCKGLFSSK